MPETQQTLVVNSSPADSAALAPKLAQELTEIAAAVVRREDIAAASQALAKCEQDREDAERAQQALNNDCVRLRSELDAARRAALHERIRAAIDSTEALGLHEEADRLEAEYRATTKSLDFLVTHIAKITKIREFRARAKYTNLRGVALGDIAQARLAETLKALAPVVTREGTVPIDPRGTLSGKLAIEAQRLIVEADNYYKAAEELLTAYLVCCGETHETALSETFQL